MDKLEAIIIGQGPAGIQAGLYLKRGNIDPLIIAKDIGASEKAHKIDNFYALPGISGIDLIQKGVQQAKDLGIDFLDDEVTSIAYLGDRFIVETSSQEFEAKTVLMATGAHRNIPRIRRIRNFEGKGISYCAVCDAYFFKEKKLAVLGAGKYAESEVKILQAISNNITLFTNGEEITGEFSKDLNINTDRIKSVYGNDTLEGVEFRDGSMFQLDGLFIAIGMASSLDLAQKIGLQVEAGRVIVDDNRSTSIPGLYAAGDCTPGVQQIAKALGDGCVAGLSMLDYLRNKKRGF